MNDGSGLKYLLTDHLGSVVAVTNDQGTLISQQRYLPFGGVRTNIGSIVQTDYGYTGQRNLDEDIGLMDYKARFYSPYLNRFIQPDTVVPSPVEPQSWNKYSYTLNNPIKYTDPTGHWVETAFDVVSLGMTINDIKNEGFTFWNTVSLVTDVASIVLPAVPAGASHVIRAAKYANKADNIIDTTKVASNFAEFWNKAKTAVKNYCSFSEDTKVTTQEGEKEIADIEEGDYVLAWNEATDEIGYYEVTDTFSHIDPVLTELIINGEWIETTPEHPFYTLEEGWLPADELESGMHIRNAEGDYELVWFKWNIEKDQEMYNFTVDTAHTYFVGEGQWLVHNECLDDVVRYPIKGQIPIPGSRTTGGNRAWAEERLLIMETGYGSQNWTKTQLDEIIKNKKLNDYSPHHINNVDNYPEWQGDPRNIIFIENGRGGGANRHIIDGHGGNWRNPSTGLLIDRMQTLLNRIR